MFNLYEIKKDTEIENIILEKGDKIYIPLLEKSFYDYDKIITKDIIEGIKHSDRMEGYIQIFRYDTFPYEFGLEGNDWDKREDEDIEKLKGFKDWFKLILEDDYYKIYSQLEDVINLGGTVTIYRAVDVREDWIDYLKKEGKHLGIYWTWDKSGADTYWSSNEIAKKFGKRNVTMLMITDIKEEYIDWVDTFKLNIDISFGDVEKEIRLFKGTPLKIKQIFIGDEEQDILGILDKIFYA